MTERYLGSIISPSPVEPSEGFADSTASGVWNVHDPLIFGQAGDWPDPTNASPSKFIENLFSCFTYTGTGSSQTITNGIDLSNEGGLVWIQQREATGYESLLFDTERGATKYISTEANAANQSDSNSLSAFASNGFTLGGGNRANNSSSSADSYVSWTFRKQPKFFDVVTYTGTGSALTVNHNLGSVPGMIWFKRTDSVGNWRVFHTSVGATKALRLNGNDVPATSSSYFNDTAPTSTQFTVGTDLSDSGGTFVAYLFAHNNNDGGFGSTGDQDIIKCGTYNGDGSTSNSISLGFEPQFIIIKNITETWSWLLFDNIRGITTDGDEKYFVLENTSQEATGDFLSLTADGFELTVNNNNTNNSSHSYIYMAIRRGPMITPTAGTQVFFPDLITANQTGPRSETGIGFSPDVIINLVRSNANYGQQVCSRITGPTKQIFTNGTSAESTTNGTALVSFDMDGYTLGSDSAGTGWNAYSGYTSVKHCFKRAPGFFDVVAYTGDGGSNRAVTHNLGVAPEFIAIRCRSNGDNFRVTTTDAFPDGLVFNSGGSLQTGVSAFNGVSTPNATNFYVANDGEVNGSGRTYIAFLFATVAGVSKVGTYSGTGNNINVDCGFTSGARFVLITRTDSSGDWFVWDSERGIVDGNDPYLVFNNASAEVTGNDKIDPLSSGFTIPSDAGSDLNTSGGSYTFLAIA